MNLLEGIAPSYMYIYVRIDFFVDLRLSFHPCGLDSTVNKFIDFPAMGLFHV